MNTKQVLSVFVVAILAGSVATVVGIQSFQVANAQSGVTIETSADDLGGTFFGLAVLQVIITDTSENDDSGDAETTIEVNVESEGVDQTIVIPDTSDGSQRFEFFIVHADNGDCDDDETADCIANPDSDDHLADAQILEFGTGADALDEGDELENDIDSFDDTSFDITYRNTEVTVDYEEAAATLTLDRETYGSDSIMYIVIKDQDGNLDPTAENDYGITDGDLLVLFTLDGGDFDGVVDFEETGDNTAEYEATVQLTDDAGLDDNELEFAEDSLVLTLIDQDDYDAIDEDSTDTDTVSFDIDDVDGVFDDLDDPTFGSELILTLRDADRNVDSDDDDVIPDAVVITSDIDGGDDEVTVDMEETDDNTGVFVPDTTNNEIKVTFVTDCGEVDDTDDILQLCRDDVTNDITEDILITYTDPFGDDGPDAIFEFEVAMTITPGTVDLPDSVGINDDFTITLTEPDLNDNPRSKDSYTLILDGEGPHPLLRAGEPLDFIATFEFEFEGDVIDFAGEVPETFVETGADTGVFTTSFDMEDIIAEGDLVVDDGDSLEVTYNDFMDDTTRESADELSVARPDTDISLSRTVIPIPPEDGSLVIDPDVGLGDDTVVLVLTVIDPDLNVDSNSEEDIPFIFGDEDDDEDNPSFRVEIDNCGDADLDEVIDDDDEFVDSTMESFMDTLLGLDLAETGRSTGVFEEDLEFVFPDVAVDPNDVQDCEIEFTYIDADGDEESVGLTIRGNDAALSVDKSSVKTGDTITVTVQDEDLNLDDGTIEEFDFTTTDDPGLLLIETEDDDIAALPTTETLRETGANTGIFTVSLVVGEDIPVTDPDDPDEQASNILVTYEDEVASTGGGGDEIEVNVAVVTATGAIQVSPDLVGPGTTISVLITDSDLNTDASGTDDFPGDDTGDGIVSFRTDRIAVGEASPDLDETGANTGVFEFEIELSPIEGGDDGEDNAPDAEGEGNPSISVLPGDILSIRYEDDRDSSGDSTVVSKVIEIKSWDPEFAADQDTYGVNDRAIITISDPDANQDPDIADSLTDVRVFSDSDAVGKEIPALETGVDTGVFRLSFQMTTGTSTGGVSVNSGDTVTVEYNDEFPGDYADRIEDVNDPDKEFTFTFTVGAGGIGTDTTTPSAPSLKDVSGDPIDEVTVGQQVVLSTTIQNNNDAEQPFVALVEVRDSDGITVFLAWQTGTLNPSGSAEVGLSWTPEEAGDYTIRTFIISDLANPQILSEVAATEITVS